MNVAKFIAWLFIGIALLFLILFTAFCFVYFPPKVIENQLSNMGLFGDFFGGIVGIILSLAGLGVTILIAILVAQNSDKQNEKNIAIQNIIIEKQLLFNELATFRTSVDGAISTLEPFDLDYELGEYKSIFDANRKLKSSVSIIFNSINRLQTLFPEFDKSPYKETFSLMKISFDDLATTISQENAKYMDSSSGPQLDIRKSLMLVAQKRAEAEGHYFSVIKMLRQPLND